MTVKIYIDPTVVLVSTKCLDAALDRLDASRNSNTAASDDGSHRDTTRLPYQLELRPNAEFAYESGIDKLANLDLEYEDDPAMTLCSQSDIQHVTGNGQDIEDPARRSHRLLKLSSRVNLESRLAVGCAGAVLSFLARKRSALYLPGNAVGDSSLQVASVATFTLREHMLVNADTIASSKLFRPNHIPVHNMEVPLRAGMVPKKGCRCTACFTNSQKLRRDGIIFDACLRGPAQILGSSANA